MQYQQILGEAGYGFPQSSAFADPYPANITRSCLKHFWNQRDARFNDCALPFIATVPALVAALILLWEAVRLLLPRRPRWLRPFVVEEVETPVLDELVPRRIWSQFTVFLLSISVIGLALQLAVAILSWKAIPACAPAVSWAIVVGLLLVFRPRTAPFATLTIYTLLTIGQFIGFAHAQGTSSVCRALEIASSVCSILGIFTILAMPLRDPHLPAKDISQPFSEPTSGLRSPEDNLTLWQFLSVTWMTPMIRIAYKRQLHDEDVWQLPYQFHHQRLHDNFRLLKGTVIRRLIRANIIDICILVFLAFLELLLQYSAPLLLQKVLASMEDMTIPRRSTVVYAALALGARLVVTQSMVLSLWYGRRCYERSRGEMITMLYEKTLARKIAFALDKKPGTSAENGTSNGEPASGDSPKDDRKSLWSKLRNTASSMFSRSKPLPPAKEPASMGKILNLMRNDVYEVAQRFWDVQLLIQTPLSIIFSVVLVIKLLGFPSMLAVLAVGLAQLINVVLARIMIHYEKKRRVATDKKLQITSQFIEAIRHLRWYGWQGAWLTQIMSARQKELNLRVISSVWNLAINFTNVLALEMSPFLAFYAYTMIAGKPLRVDLAFPALEVLAMLTASLRDLPQLIIVNINAWVAVGRIEDFMAEPDKQEMSTEALIGTEMALDHASFSWPGTAAPVLYDINLTFPIGLTVVCGEVASGKTALLQALLGELDMSDGQLIRPDEPIAYCAQTPWLQSMSIRDNILFGAPYEDKRYKAALEACALTPDLAEFKAGDLSLIGENGVGLSGGQRARVAFARAIYSRAQILLLDDPLSALDQQTGEYIVEKCFSGSLLHGRTVVLVTHRTDLVAEVADQMVQVEEGRASLLEMDAVAFKSLHRTTSTQSDQQLTQREIEERNAAAVPDKFVEDEYRARGGVKASIYWQYIRAGKLKWWFVLAFFLALWRLTNPAQAWFLKAWGEAYQRQSTLNIISSGYAATQWNPIDKLPPPDVDLRPWLFGFFLFGLALCVLYTISQGIMILIVYIAAKNLFVTTMQRVAGATFRFYDVTPVGRLMNRMTSDMTVLDGNISMRFANVTSAGLIWLTSIFIIATVTPTFLAFAAVLAVSFVVIFLRFLPTSQSLRRLEMVSLTPLMSNFGTLLNGLSTVRAFHAQKQFQDVVVRVVDTFQKMDHFYWSVQAWLSYRYDLLSSVATFLMTLLALATNLSAGTTAFVLVTAERFVNNTHRLCKQYGQLQMDFVSVERVVEILQLEQEPKGEISPPAWWPSFSGDVIFDDVTIRYAPHLDPALSDISFQIKGGSKTAIIGRTGSGKSTLALAILATILPESGKILVDSVDLAKIGKQTLRTKVTFLAQDPVLFPGSMRQNLDPVQEHTDEDCELVLRRVCAHQGWTLDTKVEGGGRNLSQGQRQLVGLARAVLRRSAIIILDEATASIDRETAMQIQQVMHEEMKESTVITIAHRLEAVRNADYCIILGKGRILQQGPASEMLAKHREHMVDDEDEDEEGGQ